MIVAAVYDRRSCGPPRNGWIGRSPGTPQFHGSGANEAPRQRALLVAPDDCNASYASTPFDKAPVS
jgi:hypothetical protein